VKRLERYITSKRDLYDSAIRNGYFLPSFNSSIITEEYLLQVINNKMWCPLFKDIRLSPCVTPPCKALLLQKLLGYLNKAKLNSGIDDKHVPDKRWLLLILSTFTPKDEISTKGTWRLRGPSCSGTTGL